MKMKISLDDYLSYVESGDKFVYSVRFINQIIQSHGFRRIYDTRKTVVVEAAESINMTNLSRFTLRQSISPGSLMSQDKGDADIKNLDWAECSNCCVTSIQSMNFNNEAPASPVLMLYKGKDIGKAEI